MLPFKKSDPGRVALFLFMLILLSCRLQSQNIGVADTIVPAKGNVNEQLGEINKKKIELHSDSTGSQPVMSARLDTATQSRYGNLLNNDTVYNKRHPVWLPAIKVLGSCLFTFALNRFLFKKDYAIQVGLNSWKYNLKTGWDWDNNRFGTSFLIRPYSGSVFFNSARANGFNYWQSFSFAVGGTVVWEYFGANTLPSYNNMINTPVNGSFLGEITYRIGSNILDDRARGMQRVFRELAAAIINPVRGLNRLLQRKTFRKINREIYQKEPLNISLYGGAQKLNSSTDDLFNTGTITGILDLQLDYGNPFESRRRKPFDFFKFSVGLSVGGGRKILDNFRGYGILKGKNFQPGAGKNAILIGAFQYTDYWDNQTFELGTIGFGGGMITKVSVHGPSESNLYTSLHLAAVPFAGSSMRSSPENSPYRDYIFGAGLEGKVESTMNLGKWATAGVVAYYYWVRSYTGFNENSFTGIIKPRITISLFKGLAIGYEHALYFNDAYSQDLPAIHRVRTEQKIFLMLYLEDKQRRGHYN